VQSEVREAMALALASTVVCSVLIAVVRDSTVALRSVASPMSAAHDATDDGDDGGAAAGGGEGVRAARKPWIVIPGCQGRRYLR
jgi:hypothetical protein